MATSHPTSADKLLSEFLEVLDSELFKALFDPVRIRVVLAVWQAASPISIGEIALQFDQDRSVISRHLKQLHRAGVLDVARIERKSVYTLNTDRFPGQVEQLLSRITQALRACCGVEQLSE